MISRWDEEILPWVQRNLRCHYSRGGVRIWARCSNVFAYRFRVTGDLEEREIEGDRRGWLQELKSHSLES
jgi:hypothetical protein